MHNGKKTQGKSIKCIHCEKVKVKLFEGGDLIFYCGVWETKPNKSTTPPFHIINFLGAVNKTHTAGAYPTSPHWCPPLWMLWMWLCINTWTYLNQQ